MQRLFRDDRSWNLIIWMNDEPNVLAQVSAGRVLDLPPVRVEKMESMVATLPMTFWKPCASEGKIEWLGA